MCLFPNFSQTAQTDSLFSIQLSWNNLGIVLVKKNLISDHQFGQKLQKLALSYAYIIRLKQFPDYLQDLKHQNGKTEVKVLVTETKYNFEVAKSYRWW